MRRTATNTGRGARRTGWDFGPHMETDHAQAERDAAAGRERAIAAERAASERIVHPVVAAPERKCFRVIRLFLNHGAVGIEDIGFAATAAPALAISTREQWRAQVLDPDGRIYSDNWRHMERR
jgi:hypothetical protein